MPYRRKPRSALRAYAWIALAFLLLAAAILPRVPPELADLEGARLTQQGRVTIGVLFFCLLLWMTESLPFHITGMLGMILLVLLKADHFKSIVQLGFGNDTVVFFIGVLTLSVCVAKAGLGQRLSLMILALTGNRTRYILLGLLIAGALVGMWVTTLAAAAFLTPLALSIAGKEGLVRGESRFGKALFIAVVWGSLIGGVGSPAGSGANPLAIGFMQDTLGVDISFIDWMAFGVPLMIVLIPIAWAALLLFFRPERSGLARSSSELRQEYKNLPPMGRSERSALLIFCVTVLLWLLSKPLESLTGVRIPASMPALLGACLFFLPGVTDIKWRDVEQEISWGGILLIASGISLGMLMYQSGAAQWMASLLLGDIARASEPMRIFAVVLIVSLLKLGLSSNSVTATVVIPIMIALAKQAGLSPLGLVIPAAMTMNTAYILVTSSPAGIIPYSSGYFSITDMARAGAAFTIAAAIAMSAVIYALGKLMNIY